MPYENLRRIASSAGMSWRLEAGGAKRDCVKIAPQNIMKKKESKKCMCLFRLV